MAEAMISALLLLPLALLFAIETFHSPYSGLVVLVVLTYPAYRVLIASVEHKAVGKTAATEGKESKAGEGAEGAASPHSASDEKKKEAEAKKEADAKADADEAAAAAAAAAAAVAVAEQRAEEERAEEERAEEERAEEVRAEEERAAAKEAAAEAANAAESARVVAEAAEQQRVENERLKAEAEAKERAAADAAEAEAEENAASAAASASAAAASAAAASAAAASAAAASAAAASAAAEEKSPPPPITTASSPPPPPGPEPLASPDRHARNRQHIYTEILETERAYVDDLRTLIDVFVDPLLGEGHKLGAGDREVVTRIFSPVLLKQLFGVHGELLASLEAAKLKSQTASSSSGDLATQFVRIAPFFKLYSPYCSMYPTALATLATLMRSGGSNALRRALEECSAHPSLRNMDVGSFLIKPIQRICKYPLFFRDIMKHVKQDAHPAFAKLDQANKAVSGIVEEVNLRTGEIVRDQAQWTLFQSVVDVAQPNGVTSITKEDLLAPTRKMIFMTPCGVLSNSGEGDGGDSGSGGKDGQGGVLVLLSDMVLFCGPHTQKKPKKKRGRAEVEVRVVLPLDGKLQAVIGGGEGGEGGDGSDDDEGTRGGVGVGVGGGASMTATLNLMHATAEGGKRLSVVELYSEREATALGDQYGAAELAVFARCVGGGGGAGGRMDAATAVAMILDAQTEHTRKSVDKQHRLSVMKLRAASLGGTGGVDAGGKRGEGDEGGDGAAAGGGGDDDAAGASAAPKRRNWTR